MGGGGGVPRLTANVYICTSIVKASMFPKLRHNETCLIIAGVGERSIDHEHFLL